MCLYEHMIGCLYLGMMLCACMVLYTRMCWICVCVHDVYACMGSVAYVYHI